MPALPRRRTTVFFGFKSYTGTDATSGIVHTVITTPANIADISMAPKLFTGHEKTGYGDSGYLGVDKRPDTLIFNMDGANIDHKISLRPSQIKAFPEDEQPAIKTQEKAKSSIRTKVEHQFSIVKRNFGFHKTRYKGIKKVSSIAFFVLALTNLILADRFVPRAA